VLKIFVTDIILIKKPLIWLIEVTFVLFSLTLYLL
jgi:hypothetical protein